MKNIKNKIKSAYHDERLNTLKQKVSIEGNVVYVNKKSKLFIPSLVSLVSSLAIFIVALILFVNPGDENLTENSAHDNTNIAILNLESNTKYYLKRPIKTVFDNENELVISVYYGLKETGDRLDHYLVIMYETQDSIILETNVSSLYNDEDLAIIRESIFNDSFELTGEKVHAVAFSIVDVIIAVKVDDEIFEFDLNLSEYYDFLIN